ncbi:MAG: cbb3-type cytochrome c oxidase subunit 3 [Myxococcota bacterium]
MSIVLASVLKEGATMATMGWLMAVMTVFFMSVMTAWIVWTWWPSRRELMDAASRLPLEED